MSTSLNQVYKDRESIQTALQSAIVALDDWACSYAPEMCDEERVKEAQARLSEYGTLYYIALTLEQCRKALKS